ncbi:Branched-chain acyl-CoA dehydrogenase [Candidatus Rhodobacter oscarellae]|uniref:Branched-chain acyl-CoA dehydrogenase n=1 Tax=Candidatus Rhodobacter oscarellae TaxID=1675527 RepID=A0A0J9E4C6_9RHOB|nr:acyl-CoA dehydrogenase family protein [Candidatus Rhodobacter lobularis]KMW56704.1 Branched-chain acyl-CoA dehydrogenase [Candidatus Rhodobacter lobularis]
MDFALSEEQQAIFDMARGFGEGHIAPHARQWEAEGTIPKELWRKMAELGLAGIYVSEENGGSGLSRLDATLVFEGLSRSCAATAAFMTIHNMCAGMIDKFGSDELKARYLPKMVTAEMFFSYCLTEPGSGSDAAALKTRAERTPTPSSSEAVGHNSWGYKLNGTKAFISGGGYSDAFLTMTRTGEDGPKGISAIIIEHGTDGMSYGAPEDKMGWRAQPTAQVQFDDCHVGAEQLVGEEGKGFAYAMAGLDGGRLNISSCSLGAAQAALEQTLTYMGERKTFGRSIDSYQALQFRLAEMEIEMQAARTFLRQAAWKLDQGAPDASKFCAMAKAFVTETCSKVADRCLQMHGGYGYLGDYGIEKTVRDLRVHTILEGTSEVMRLIVSRQLLAER